MELKISKILNLHMALEYLNRKETKAWYGIGRNISAILPIIKSVGEHQVELLDKLGAKKNANGGYEMSPSGPVFEDKEGQPGSGLQAEQEYKRLWDAFSEETRDVKIYQFPAAQLMGYDLQAGITEPMMVLFSDIDQEEPKEEAPSQAI